MMSGIRLRHLAFTGQDTEVAELKFEDGLNIIYGASNTGKSFTAKGILYMLGVSKSLPENEEIVGYDGVWLGLTMADGKDVTLFRSTRGGAFKLYKGLVTAEVEDEGVILKAQHDSAKTDNVSHLLLNEMGLWGKKVVRDQYGKKNNLSTYLLSPYSVVSEEAIISEKSPVFASGVPAERVFEQNLLKLLLTGVDDKLAVTVPKLSERKVAKAAKMELLEEMISQLDEELGNPTPSQEELEEQMRRLDESLSAIVPDFQAAQLQIDTLTNERRAKFDRQRELGDQASELGLTLERFARLEAVYSSDLRRLQSIEEGGYLLVAMAGMDCPVCGASPDAQHHNHAAEDIQNAYAAAAAESVKIEREQRELNQTMASLQAEYTGLNKTLAQVEVDIKAIDKELREMLSIEASVRANYVKIDSKRQEITKILDVIGRRIRLSDRKAEIEATSIKTENSGMSVGIDATTAFEFGEVIRSVLQAWNFPDADKVQFDLATNDVTIKGKRRAANGKGVRAILHAAFNVGVIIYCIAKKLPHPGFLVLDTPLLTYREPLGSKYGELSDDERLLKGTSVAEYFYKHLASLKPHVQIIVLENSDPPQGILPLANIEIFTHDENRGRFGLLAR